MNSLNKGQHNRQMQKAHLAGLATLRFARLCGRRYMQIIMKHLCLKSLFHFVILAISFSAVSSEAVVFSKDDARKNEITAQLHKHRKIDASELIVDVPNLLNGEEYLGAYVWLYNGNELITGFNPLQGRPIKKRNFHSLSLTLNEVIVTKIKVVLFYGNQENQYEITYETNSI